MVHVVEFVDLRARMTSGEQYEETPAIFEMARERLAAHIERWGRLPSRADYWAEMCTCDVVVSTATHEFFGVAVLEAVYAGCLALLPNRSWMAHVSGRNWAKDGTESFSSDREISEKALLAHTETESRRSHGVSACVSDLPNVLSAIRLPCASIHTALPFLAFNSPEGGLSGRQQWVLKRTPTPRTRELLLPRRMGPRVPDYMLLPDDVARSLPVCYTHRALYCYCVRWNSSNPPPSGLNRII